MLAGSDDDDEDEWGNASRGGINFLSFGCYARSKYILCRLVYLCLDSFYTEYVQYFCISDHLAGVKVLHGLDKVMEGGAVVLTLKDQSILAGDDINEGIKCISI